MEIGDIIGRRNKKGIIDMLFAIKDVKLMKGVYLYNDKEGIWEGEFIILKC